MRIVLLSWMIYSRRHHDLYTLPLRERGVRVDFYDCTPYFRPEGFRKIKLPESIDYDGVRLLHTREEIERALAELPEDAVVISLIPLENETLFLFRALRRAGARFGATMSKWRPNPYCDSLSGRNLDTPMKRLRTRYTSAKKLMRTLCRSPRVPSEWLGLPSADFIITNSRTEWESRYPIGPRTRYIRAHSQEMSDEVCAAHIRLYVNDFSIDLGNEGEAAVNTLLSRAEAAGLIPHSRQGVFLT